MLILLAFGTKEAETIKETLSSGQWPDGQPHRPNPQRAQSAEVYLKAQDYAALWPSLKIISCWDRAFAASDADRLRKLFPKVDVEGKGLIATEGIVTIPWGQRHVAAIMAHTLHLDPYDMDTGESDSTRRIPVYEAKKGGNYSIIVTTGNGFTDYALGDIVRCVGHVARTPCLEFQFRSGGVVDLHGEKLHARHVAEIIARLEARHGAFRFAMLMPRTDRGGYIFVCSEEDACSEEELETLLCENYHYRHARNLRQLAPVQISRHPDALSVFCSIKQCSPVAVKIPPLYVPRNVNEWHEFEHRFR